MKVKKIVIILIIAIIVIIGILFMKNKIDEKNVTYNITNVEEYNYFLSKSEKKIGVIDKEGKKVIEAKYDAIVIPNPQKDIFVCTENEKNIVLNSKGEELFSEYEEIEPIRLKSSASTLCYEKNSLKFKKDNLYGLIDLDGNIIVENKYDDIENLQRTEGKFIVSKNEKYGIINLKGKEIISPKYDSILTDGYYNEETKYNKSGYIVSTRENDGYKYGYINYKGKVVLKNQYNLIERIIDINDKNIYLIAQENGKTGLYRNSKEIVKPEYQSIEYDEDSNLLFVQKNKSYGAITLKGKVKIEVNKSSIETKGIYIYTKSNSKNIVYDKNCNEVNIDFNRSFYKTENENYNISTLENNNIIYYGITDKNNTILVKEEYRYIEYLNDNYFIAKNESGKLGVINSNGKEVLEFKYDLIQKIKETNIIQTLIAENSETILYSSKLEELYKGNNITIKNYLGYIEVKDNENKNYFSNSGEKIDEENGIIKKSKLTSEPENIGEYKRVQYTLNDIYYIK